MAHLKKGTLRPPFFWGGGGGKDILVGLLSRNMQPSGAIYYTFSLSHSFTSLQFYKAILIDLTTEAEQKPILVIS